MFTTMFTYMWTNNKLFPPPSTGYKEVDVIIRLSRAATVLAMLEFGMIYHEAYLCPLDY